jgi:hypothetical protein
VFKLILRANLTNEELLVILFEVSKAIKTDKHQGIIKDKDGIDIGTWRRTR